MWPFGRHRGAKPGASADHVFRADRAEWRGLAPIATVQTVPFETVDVAFEQRLATRAAPVFLAPLGHHVRPDAPAGAVSGLAVPTTPVQRSFAPDTGADRATRVVASEARHAPAAAVNADDRTAGVHEERPVAPHLARQALVVADPPQLPAVPRPVVVARTADDNVAETDPVEDGVAAGPSRAFDDEAGPEGGGAAPAPDVAGELPADAADVPLIAQRAPVDAPPNADAGSTGDAAPAVQRTVPSSPRSPSMGDSGLPVMPTTVQRARPAVRIGPPLDGPAPVQRQASVSNPTPATHEATAPPPGAPRIGPPLSGRPPVQRSTSPTAPSASPPHTETPTTPTATGTRSDSPAPQRSGRDSSQSSIRAESVPETGIDRAEIERGATTAGPTAEAGTTEPEIVRPTIAASSPPMTAVTTPAVAAEPPLVAQRSGRDSSQSSIRAGFVPETGTDPAEIERGVATTATLGVSSSTSASPPPSPPTASAPSPTASTPPVVAARRVEAPATHTAPLVAARQIAGETSPTEISGRGLLGTAVDDPARPSGPVTAVRQLLAERPLIPSIDVERASAAAADVGASTTTAESMKPRDNAPSSARDPGARVQPLQRAGGAALQRSSISAAAPPTSSPGAARTWSSASSPAGAGPAGFVTLDDGSLVPLGVAPPSNDGESTITEFVQRQAEPPATPPASDQVGAAAAPTTMTAVATAGPAAAGPAATAPPSEEQVQNLVRALYPPLHRRLCRDLLLDRERAGYRTDIRF